MSNYPTRRPFHAQHVIRAMTKTAVAQEIGANACWLVALIAAQEDAKRYMGPCTWFNAQLQPLVGSRKWETLDAMRHRAVESGWLHYEAPPEGGRTPGIYWTNIPNEESIDTTTPCDESDALRRAYNAGLRDGLRLANASRPFPKNGDSGDGPYPQYGYGRGDDPGNGMGELSNLSLSLREIDHPEQARDAFTVDDKNATARVPKFSNEDHKCAESLGEKLLELKPDFRDLQPDRRKTTLAKWAEHVRLMRERDGRTHAQILELFSRVRRDRFWKMNCLSPETLRAKWDQIDLATGKAAQQSPTDSTPRKLLGPPPARKVVQHENR